MPIYDPLGSEHTYHASTPTETARACHTLDSNVAYMGCQESPGQGFAVYINRRSSEDKDKEDFHRDVESQDTQMTAMREKVSVTIHRKIFILCDTFNGQ